ncbi:MAG: transposase [Lewinellaceae bacterium]|nr:transposase [Lewinellaceae bacterium]
MNWQRIRKYDLREVFNANIMDYPNRGANGETWTAAFRLGNRCIIILKHGAGKACFKQMCQALNMLERIQLDREPDPSLLISDSQSVKLSPMIFEHRGTDGNKRVNGRKRQVLVDVLGRIWSAAVHAANHHDSPGGVALLDELPKPMPRLEKIMGDKSYRGTFAEAVEQMGLVFEVPNREEGTKGFVVEAKRWVVERTFAWLNFFRRVVVDYEHTPQSSVSFLFLANISMVIWRIKWNDL